MPIFKDESCEDVALITDLAVSVADFWNNNGGMDFGCQVVVDEPSVREMSEQGDSVLSAYFHPEFGPFKRVAAALVMARLEPPFRLITSASDDVNIVPVRSDFERLWLPRVVFLMLQPAMAQVQLVGSGNGESLLTAWNGFPSLHAKADFLFWLEWLCDYPDSVLTDEAARLERRGRMILGTALILEATYYRGEYKHPMCGVCDKKVFAAFKEPSLFIFDAMLHDNWARKNPS